MTKISSTFSGGPLLSPRTTDYIATLIREGDDFDYSKWLKRTREEEADTEKSRAAFNSNDVMASEGAANSTNTPGYEDAWLSVGPTPIKPVPVPRTIFRSARQDIGNPEIRIRQRLERVRDAWDRFQASRVRDAVYGYLEAVFAIVEHYRVRRKTNRLLRHAFKFANLSFGRKSDAFTAIIRCTSADEVDSKTISKWARALRYVFRCKVPRAQLKTFMKEAGGVTACAELYARCFGRCA